MRKIPFAGIELTSQRVRGLRGTSELPGRPAYSMIITDLYPDSRVLLPGCWYTCIAISVALSVQYNGGFLPDITLDKRFDNFLP